MSSRILTLALFLNFQKWFGHFWQQQNVELFFEFKITLNYTPPFCWWQKCFENMKTLAKEKEMARPKMKSRGGDMQTEQLHEHVTWINLRAIESKPNGLQSQCNLKSPHELLRPSTMRCYKSNRHRKIHGVLIGITCGLLQYDCHLIMACVPELFISSRQSNR